MPTFLAVPMIIPHSKSFKRFALPIFTVTSVVTTSYDAESSLYKQLCIVTSFYVTVGVVYFQITDVSSVIVWALHVHDDQLAIMVTVNLFTEKFVKLRNEKWLLELNTEN